MKRFLLIVGLILAELWLWHGGAGFAAVEPRIALVIGNSGYKIAPSLANPANDARLMAETLRGLGFDVIERIDADRETILLATFELQDRLIAGGKDAVGLFYYAGHGVQVAGENYFIPLKTDIRQEREISVKAVSASFVLNQMEFAGNRMNFVILDACRNNPFPASSRAATRGLARMNAPTGSLVAYSTGPGEVAVDGVGENSPYVLALTEAMLTPGIAAEQMFKRARESVLEATNDEQTPWEESSLKGGDFYFTAVELVTAAASEASTTNYNAATTQQESLFWQSIKDTSDPEMFEAYLEQYPAGTFAALARLRIKQFEENKTAAILPPPEPERETQQEVETALITPSVAIEISRPEDIEHLITLAADDYHNAPADTWTPVTGAALDKYLSHRWYGGRYIEKNGIEGQWKGILLQGRKGDIYTTQKLRGTSQGEKGDLRIEADRYCIYWHGYGELCYRVLAGTVKGIPVHVLTRDNGKFYSGIELLITDGMTYLPIEGKQTDTIVSPLRRITSQIGR